MAFYDRGLVCVNKYPQYVTGEWLVKYITKLHYGGDPDMDGEEFEDSALVGKFKLVDVPIDKVRIWSPTGCDDQVAEDFAELKTKFPPIVLDATFEIIDGTHRLEAAKIRGQKTIQAYVPVTGKVSSFISIPLGKLQAPMTKVAISVPELVAQTNSFSVKRRPNCAATLLDSNPKQLFLHYSVKCHESYSDPAGHDVRVKFDVSKVEDTQNANDLDVQLNCSCPAFLYWGAQWNLHQRDGLLDEPRPELVAPTKQLDLRGNFVICKHCKVVLERILPSVQHNMINIVRDIQVRRNKEQLKQKETPERLKKEQDAMKKRQELKKIRQMKNKEVQQKLLDALRKREEEQALQEVEHDEDKVRAEDGENPEVVGRDKPATEGVAVVDTPKTEDIKEEERFEPDEEEDVTYLLENEEKKLKQQEHKKLENKPHLHKGLPYETDEEKQEHGHKVPTDEELNKVLKEDPAAAASRKRLKKLRDDKFKNWKRKRNSLETELLDKVAEGDNENSY